MRTSYPQGANGVKPSAASGSSPSSTAKPKYTALFAKQTATLRPFYREPYNQIVNPDAINRYLVRRWLPDLGPEGLAIVMVLRSLCYYNPKEGALRAECEITLADLAKMAGMSRSALCREFDRNSALGEFVERKAAYAVRGNVAHRAPNIYFVAMETPIHPDDLEEYNRLKALQEQEPEPLPTTPTGAILKRVPAENPHASQNGTHGKNLPSAHECQNGTHGRNSDSHESLNGSADAKHLAPHSGTADATHLQPHCDPAIQVSSPSGGSLPSVDSDTPAAGQIPPQSDPQGGGEEEVVEDVCELIRGSMADADLRRGWDRMLRGAATKVNKPTFETHIRPLKPLSYDPNHGVVRVLCKSDFVKEWLDKRHVPLLRELLEEHFGREINLRLITPKILEKEANVVG